MKFKQKELKIKNITPVEKKPAHFGKRIAAGVLAAFMLASPLVSGNVHAQNGNGPAGSQGSEVATKAGTRAEKSKPKSKKMNPETKKLADKAGKKIQERMAEIDELLGTTGQGGTGNMTAEELLADPGKNPAEGAGEAPAPVAEPKAEEEPSQEEGGAGEEVDEPGTEEGGRVIHNFLFRPTNWEIGRYIETNLEPIPGMVGTRKEAPKEGFSQRVDLGVNAIGNEAGHAVFGTFRYLNLIRLDTGAAMFVGMPMVPIGRLMLSPELAIHYNKGEKGEGAVKGAYYGSAAFAGNLPSWIYSSHSVGLGWAQSAGENFKLRIAGIIGGALSYPVWDDIYVNFSTGLSMEFWKTVLLYGAPTCYFAADNPMRTAYIGYYEPKFQDVEVGIQVMLPQGFVTRAFADIGIVGEEYGISNKYGFKLTKMMHTDSVELDVWGTIGMTQWSQLFGGGVDPLIMVGLSGSYAGKSYRSTNSYSFSHARMLDVSAPKTDFPDKEHPGPYGFGRSGDPYFDVPINEAKQRMVDAGNFAQFSSTYAGASQEEVITTARFLGAFMAQVAYANDAFDSMTTGNIFDPEIQRIADASHEEMFQYLKAYVNWYQSHGSGEQLPESLAGGIAVCAGIHSLITAYLNANGIPAVTGSVNTPNGPHMVPVIPNLDGKTVVLDYGDQISADGDFLHMYDAYGRQKGAPTFKSQIYGPNGEYLGTIDTSAERLLRGAMGIDNKEILLRNYLGVW